MSHSPRDPAREGFLSEAQEIIERLSRDLLLIHPSTPSAQSVPSAPAGDPIPDIVNGLFRGVHTLKGLASTYNAPPIAMLANELENVLNDLRLERVTLTAEVVDQLVRAVGIFHRLLATCEGHSIGEPDAEIVSYLCDLHRVANPTATAPSQTVLHDLDASFLAVLTEYEEHRLRSVIDKGMRLYRIRVAMSVATIDAELELFKGQIRLFGEILTYVPTGETVATDSIELDVLLASDEEVGPIQLAVASSGGVVEQMHAFLPPAHPSIKHNPIEPTVPAPTAHVLATSTHPDTSLRSIAQTVRVDLGRIDRLDSLVGELATVLEGVADLLDRTRREPLLTQFAGELGQLHDGFDRRLTLLRRAIVDLRMVPLADVFEKLARVVRQASHEVNREVHLIVTGAETEVDKLIVEELSDPLMHMVPNAVDHGIEDGDLRERIRKPRAGTLALNAYVTGRVLVVEVEDDGAGIQAERLVRAAAEQHFLTLEEGDALTVREKYALMFLPGLSTRADPGCLSGRGVGMDVVRTNIERLGGVVDVHSELGIGTRMTIKIPLSPAVDGFENS